MAPRAEEPQQHPQHRLHLSLKRMMLETFRTTRALGHNGRLSWTASCKVSSHAPTAFTRLHDGCFGSVSDVRAAHRTGTHPALIEALEPHEKKLKALTAQADRLRQLEIGNINAHHDYEKQQPEDENRVRHAARAARSPTTRVIVMIDSLTSLQTTRVCQLRRRSSNSSRAA